MAQYRNTSNQNIPAIPSAVQVNFTSTIVGGQPLTVDTSGVYGFSYHINGSQTLGFIPAEMVTELTVTDPSGITSALNWTRGYDTITVDEHGSVGNAGEVQLGAGDTVGVHAYMNAVGSGQAYQTDRFLCNLTLRKL